jgi:environmental stress-induced protein Ves
MSETSLPPGWSHFALRQIAATPWRNGGGLTRQIASGSTRHADADADAWDWRISVADVVEEGSFSVFAGTDRQSALAAGNTLHLRCGDELLAFAALGDLHAFAGEMALTSDLPDGPVRLFNVMTRRDSARAELQALHSDACIETHGDSVLVLMCVRGAARTILNGLDGATGIAAPLQHGEGISIAMGTHAKINIQRLSPDACLLFARIQALVRG